MKEVADLRQRHIVPTHSLNTDKDVIFHLCYFIERISETFIGKQAKLGILSKNDREKVSKVYPQENKKKEKIVTYIFLH